MNNELTDEELLYASEEEWAFFNKCIEGLPTMEGKNGDGKDKFGEYIPYSSGPHIIKHFKSTLDIVEPKRILEIGFNLGYSSSMWLHLDSVEVMSCDISRKDETLEAAEIIYYKFHDRFGFNWREDLDTMEFEPYYYDLIFIDGSHIGKDIIKDIQLAKRLQIPYLLFDDWYPRFGETQQAVAKFPELELVKDMNNLRLYKFKS